MKKCAIDGCDNGVFYKESGLCTACYSSLYYWRKKSVTEVMRRKRKLHVFASRMEVAEPKVKVMRRRKKA